MKNDIYRTSRNLYIIEEASAYLITLLITGGYLAKLSLYMGFSDGITALLASIVNLGYVFQIFAISVFKQGRAKIKVTIFYIINELLVIMLYVTPFIKISTDIKKPLFMLFCLSGYFFLNIAASPKTNWFMTLVPLEIRGKFTAFKEAVSLVCGVLFSFCAGRIFDYYEKIGKTTSAFVIFGMIIFGLMIIHSLSLIFSKEKDKEERVDNKESLFKSIKNILTDRKTFSVILFGVLWTVCNAFSTPFFGTYQVKELGFSMTFIAILSAVNAVSRIVASIFLGAYADKTSFIKMLRICYIFASLSFISSTLAMPSCGRIMFLLQSVFLGAAMGGINSAQINLVFDYICPEKRKNTLSVQYTLCGLFGFSSTLVATPILNCLQRNEFNIFGIHIYAQQMLSFASFILTLILIKYSSVFIRKFQRKYE